MPAPPPPKLSSTLHRQHHPAASKPARHHLHVARCLPEQLPKPPPPNQLLSLLTAVPDWADAVSERRIQDRRALYTHAQWREHRSSLRHLRHLLSSFSSRVILSLVPPVSAFTAFAAAVATYNTLVPDYALTASSLPYQLTAPALALLLVFRTEASYARFDEGRKAWMRVLAGAAELAGMVMHRGGEERGDEELGRAALFNYILAFPVALKTKAGRSDRLQSVAYAAKRLCYHRCCFAAQPSEESALAATWDTTILSPPARKYATDWRRLLPLDDMHDSGPRKSRRCRSPACTIQDAGAAECGAPTHGRHDRRFGKNETHVSERWDAK